MCRLGQEVDHFRGKFGPRLRRHESPTATRIFTTRGLEIAMRETAVVVLFRGAHQRVS